MSRLRIFLFLLATVALLAFAVHLGTPAPTHAAAPAWEVVICSCKTCAQHPYVECQIGPGDGYSILCADYLRINC